MLCFFPPRPAVLLVGVPGWLQREWERWRRSRPVDGHVRGDRLNRAPENMRPPNHVYEYVLSSGNNRFFVFRSMRNIDRLLVSFRIPDDNDPANFLTPKPKPQSQQESRRPPPPADRRQETLGGQRSEISATLLMPMSWTGRKSCRRGSIAQSPGA